MGTLTINSNKSAYLSYQNPSINYSSGSEIELLNSLDGLLIGFESTNLSSIQYKKVNEINWYVYARTQLYNQPSTLDAYTISEAWTENTVTYQSQPSVANKSQYSGSVRNQTAEWVRGKWTWAADAITYGIKIDLHSGYKLVYIATSRDASHKPYLVIDYSDENVGRRLYSAAPQGGYIPKNTAKKFVWKTELDGSCVGTVTITGTKFRWRVDANSTATEINCNGNEYYTLAGASITTDSLQWQGETTDSAGNTFTTPWYTMNTVEPQSTAVAISPDNTIVDGSSPVEFVWGHQISTGTAPTKSVISHSYDGGTTWTTLKTVNGSATKTTIPAGTLSSGDVTWAVLTYNTEGVAGVWSNYAHISVISAPDAPVVSVEQTPRPLISWQASGQEGYQIRIVGVWESGSIYGIDNSKKCPVIIPDGDYAVEVRVVNSYGLWSDWGSAPLTVANSAGSAITLTASASGNIYLSWTTSGTYERYVVERDGEPIAVTTETGYTDNTAVGEHSYKICGIISGSDNYGVSNEASVNLEITTNIITDLDTGDILELPYSTTTIREEQIELSRETSVVHVSGAGYPFAEVSEWKNKSMTLEAAFDVLENAKRLETMVGHLVCVKAKNGESVVGVLPSLRKVSSAFWVDYTTTVEQIDRTEVVEL